MRSKWSLEVDGGVEGSGDGGGSREAGRARDAGLIKGRHGCVRLFGAGRVPRARAGPRDALRRVVEAYSTNGARSRGLEGRVARRAYIRGEGRGPCDLLLRALRFGLCCEFASFEVS